MEVQKEFDIFYQYISGFYRVPIDSCPETLSDVPATTEISDLISQLKKGFKFVGSTVI